MAAKAPTAATFVPSNHPLLLLLRRSATSLRHLKQAHTHLLVSGQLTRHPFLLSTFLSLLLSLDPTPLHYAHQLLLHSPTTPNLFSFNSLIQHSSYPLSFRLFRSLLHRDLLPNHYTFTFVLDSMADIWFEVGVTNCIESVHTQVFRRGFSGNVFVCNVLVRVYGVLGRMGDARKMFDGGFARDLVSWNSLLGGYVGNGDLERGMEVFEAMPERDVVAWSTAIAGFVKVGQFVEALELFCEMQKANVTANEYTLTSMLAACANLVALDQGKWIHTYIRKARIKMNDRLLAGLVDMYAKCGEIEIASRVFEDGHPKRTTRPWNAMLGGYAIHGRSREAIALFERMKLELVLPDKITFISLLQACSHGRLVDEGKSYFQLMSTFDITPEIEHYGCMVDLFGRAGRLKEAEEFVSSMLIQPDAVIWGSLLNACRIHGDIEMVKRIETTIKGLDPKSYVGCQVLLSNVYSKSGHWADARNVRETIEVAGSKKTPGCSSIELDGMFHQFLVGDRSHPQTKEIYLFLDEITMKLKIAGYEAETSEVLLDVDEEEKETALLKHSEKLAIAFGIMNTRPGTTIRIVKNLRVCMDCHRATKLISKVYNREIIVRDRIRFHHFKDGFCSCNDCW